MTAIHRYETRRKMSSEQRDVFYKYMAFGGIDVGPNMFQGLSPADRKEMDKDDIINALAQTSISEDKHHIGEEGSIWVIDFKGVMEGFISRRVPHFWDLPTYESVKLITNVLSNFMSYLLHHNVCPEYTSDVLATRSLLERDAPRELWNVKQAQRWMPGDFNIACSTLFGGFYAKNYDGLTDWAHEKDEGRPENIFVGMTDEEARNVAKFAIAAAASESQCYTWVEYANENIVDVEWTEEGGAFEITKIFPVTLETKQFYKKESPGYRPVGRVLARKWHNPAARDEDLTDAEKEAIASQQKQNNNNATTSELTVYNPERDYDYEFFLEAQVLQYCFPGMKVEATIYKLNCGIMFFDTVGRAYCSFDRFLPNELMLDYTKPRAIGVKAEEEAEERRRVEWEEEQKHKVEIENSLKEWEAEYANGHDQIAEDGEVAGREVEEGQNMPVMPQKDEGMRSTVYHPVMETIEEVDPSTVELA